MLHYKTPSLNRTSARGNNNAKNEKAIRNLKAGKSMAET
jgi:hypothetical protein